MKIKGKGFRGSAEKRLRKSVSKTTGIPVSRISSKDSQLCIIDDFHDPLPLADIKITKSSSRYNIFEVDIHENEIMGLQGVNLEPLEKNPYRKCIIL